MNCADEIYIRDYRDIVSQRIFEYWILPNESDNKYTRGVVSMLTGSEAYFGAGIISTASAVNSGAGMVRYLCDNDYKYNLLLKTPEIVFGAGKTDCCVLGSGIPAAKNKVDGTQSLSKSDIASLSKNDIAAINKIKQTLRDNITSKNDLSKPFIVVDAGALNILAKILRERNGSEYIKDCSKEIKLHGSSVGNVSAENSEIISAEPVNVLITPHKKELSEFLNAYLDLRGEDTVKTSDIEKDSVYFAKLTGRITGVTVLLKGASTIISDYANTYVVSNSTPWTAVAGSGDCLSGILGVLFAQNRHAQISKTNEESMSKAPLFDAVRIAVCGAVTHNIASQIATGQLSRPYKNIETEADANMLLNGEIKIPVSDLKNDNDYIITGNGKPIHAMSIVESIPDAIGILIDAREI